MRVITLRNQRKSVTMIPLQLVKCRMHYWPKIILLTNRKKKRRREKKEEKEKEKKERGK